MEASRFCSLKMLWVIEGHLCYLCSTVWVLKLLLQASFHLLDLWNQFQLVVLIFQQLADRHLFYAWVPPFFSSSFLPCLSEKQYKSTCLFEPFLRLIALASLACQPVLVRRRHIHCFEWDRIIYIEQPSLETHPSARGFHHQITERNWKPVWQVAISSASGSSPMDSSFCCWYKWPYAPQWYSAAARCTHIASSLACTQSCKDMEDPLPQLLDRLGLCPSSRTHMFGS